MTFPKKPMKGEQVEVDHFPRLTFPKLGSSKIDGFRCILGKQPLSSRLKPFPNLFLNRELKGLLRENLLDGELTVGPKRGEGVLQRTSSGITSEAGQPDFTLWVFDTPQVGYNFRDRLRLAEQIVRHLNHPRIRMHPHTLITDPEDLQDYIELCLAGGYEGVMIRDPNGPYKEGKSTVKQEWLLKIKPFEDCEARITGYYEEMENTNEAKRDPTGRSKRSSHKEGKIPKGTLGGFTGIDIKSGTEVRVGGGFTAEQRREFWPRRDTFIGQIMTYKKQKVGEKDKPRHTSFKAIRPEWDMDTDTLGE